MKIENFWRNLRGKTNKKKFGPIMLKLHFTTVSTIQCHVLLSLISTIVPLRKRLGKKLESQTVWNFAFVEKSVFSDKAAK